MKHIDDPLARAGDAGNPGPLFAAPPHNGATTSKAAAAAIALSAHSLREAIYTFLSNRRGQGATDEEIQLALGMHANTQRPRRVELVERGIVVDSGRTRPTRSGRRAVVWTIN
jgi:hypothetical protein